VLAEVVGVDIATDLEDHFDRVATQRLSVFVHE
jgi:hypothetical protein